ncbi:MAG: alpha/beta hydrolase [Nanoarchaeota archaeon]
MENIKLKNKCGITIEATLQKADTNKESIVVFCHGLMSTKNRSKLKELGEIFSKNNINFIRFDFLGCGNSGDYLISAKDEVEDLKTIIEFLKSKGFSNIGLLGESFGGLVSCLTYSRDIKTIVLWAPLTNAKVHYLWNEKREIIEKQGYVEVKKREKIHKLSKEFFMETNSINQENILSNIKCPVLIIHGDEDKTIPLEHSKSAMKYLSKDSILEIVKGGSHYIDEFDETFKLTIDWFKKNL